MYDPIKINVMNFNGELKHSIIIVGDVPEEVKKTLSQKSANPKILEKHYGKSWRNKLFMEKKGGDEEEFSIDDLTDIIKAPTEKVEVPKDYNKINYSFVDIFSFDTVLELKQKLEFITEIPLFAQYLCYYYKNNYFACMYTFEYKSQVFHPNIFRAIKSKGEKIENIPINKTFADISVHAKIKTYDFAIILEEMTAKYGTREYFIFDVRDFVTNSIKEKLASSGNETEMKIIYYGFVMPYFPVFTYQVFLDYIQLPPNDFFGRYQHIKNGPDFKKVLETEAEITYKTFEFINDAKKYKCVKDKIITGIESCILQVFTKYKKSSIVHIRNLFDVFPLNEIIVASSCNVGYRGGRFILRKTYKKNTGIKFQQSINQLSFKIRYNMQTTEFFTLTINRNGNYFVSSNFLEEYAYDFHDIVNLLSKVVNPIIEKINALHSSVLIGNNRLDLMRFENVKFIEVKTFIIWKAPVSMENYGVYMDILSKFAKARIITVADSTAEYDKFYYNKGVYQIEIERIEKNIEVNNYYSFLTDSKVRYTTLSMFKQNRVMYIENRNFDMRISIEGMRDKEFYTYFNYMLYSLLLYSNQYSHNSALQKTSAKSIKSLKSQDPVLYNFKKLYNTTVPYSKICQKPFQPIILNTAEQKKGAVKYWNFTTRSSAYYYCPNPKFPNLTFLVKKHPKDFCIPCCKKKDMMESNSKSNIYEKCLKEHIYTSKKNMIETRYIMNYGKYIEPGRICKLPDKFMQPFVYNSFTTSQLLEKDDGYFLYGVHQNAAGVKNTGLLSALVLIFEKDIKSIVEEFIQLINAKKHLFAVILNGGIYRYFNNHKEFTQSLHDTFISGSITSELPWHDIFKDILFFFNNINVIEFIDFVPYNANIGDITINLPSNIKSGGDLKISSRNIIIFKKMNNIFPVFLINPTNYFSAGIIKKKIFDADEQIVDVISYLMDYFQNKESSNSNTMEMSDLNSFICDNKKFKIKSVFVNKSNLCYIVELNDLFIPVKYVYYKASHDVVVNYEPFKRSGKNDFKTLNNFLLEYNKWNIQRNKKMGREPAYKTVVVEKWLVYNEKVIGFRYTDLNFYVQLDLKTALNFKQAPMIKIYYEIDKLNAVAFDETAPQDDNRTMNIYKNLYHYHSYDLFVIKFMSYFNISRNSGFRQFLKKELEKNDENINENIERELLKIYVKEYEKGKKTQNISQIVKEKEEGEIESLHHFKIFLINDLSKLEAQINEHMKGNIDLKTLHEIINNTNYAFDFIEIHQLKNMSLDKARKQLENLAKKLFTIKKDIKFKDSYFPNIFNICSSKSAAEFCDGEKLIIEKNKFCDYLEIFLQDLLNPLKEQWLFSIMFSDNVFSFFEFINRANENIEVLQLW